MPKWNQPARPQLSSGLQGSSGPRRNRFAGSADVPVVHLPLGPGRERGRSEPVALPDHQAAAPARPPADDRLLRESQAKLDAVCSQLGLAELKLKDALELIRRYEADIAALQATVSAQQAELAATSAALAAAAPSERGERPDKPSHEAVPDVQAIRKNPVGRPRGPAKTVDDATRRKPAREPKPVKWWIRSS